MSIVLIEIYDEYTNNKTIKKLEEFTKLTFPSDGTDKLFIACVLILIFHVYKTKLSTETLYMVALAGKEKIGNSNLLEFYFDRINDDKLIAKYLGKVIKDKDFDKKLDLILEYLKERSFDFVSIIKREYSQKINDYINKSKIEVEGKK